MLDVADSCGAIYGKVHTLNELRQKSGGRHSYGGMIAEDITVDIIHQRTQSG